MKLLTIFLFAAVAHAQSPTIPSDSDQAISGTLNFVGSVTQGITQLVQTTVPPIMSFGWSLLALFGAYSLLQVLLQGSIKMMTAHHTSSMAMAAAYVAVMFRICCCVAMLSFYNTPMPGVGINFHQLFPALANSLASSISTTNAQQVISALNDATHYLPTPGILDVLPSLLTIILLVIFGLIELAMVIITAGSYAIVGLLTLCGPLMIPFYVLPGGHDKRFWTWFDNMLAYSMYVFAATAFVYIFCNPYLQFFANIHSYTVGQWLPQISYLIVITVSFLWAMFKVPEITHLIFGGAGGVAQGFANTFQGVAVRAVMAAAVA
jgi:hypothetical protein